MIYPRQNSNDYYNEYNFMGGYRYTYYKGRDREGIELEAIEQEQGLDTRLNNHYMKIINEFN